MVRKESVKYFFAKMSFVEIVPPPPAEGSSGGHCGGGRRRGAAADEGGDRPLPGGGRPDGRVWGPPRVEGSYD